MRVPTPREIVQEPYECELLGLMLKPFVFQCILQLRYHVIGLHFAEFVSMPDLLVANLPVACAAKLVGTGPIAQPQIERFKAKFLEPAMCDNFTNAMRPNALLVGYQADSLL